MSVAEGKQCVMDAAQICEGLGYSTFVPAKETCTPVDMIVNGYRVQVKKRSECASKPNCIRLVTNKGPSCAAYCAGSFDVLVVQWKERWWYIIPECRLRVGHGIRNGLYMPDHGEWCGRWDVLQGNRQVISAQREFEF